MGKYEPLADHLRKLGRGRVPMKFAEIEAVLGFTLPPSSRKHRGWWSNNPANNVMTRAWIDAGFHTEDVDMEQRKLVFHRVAPEAASLDPDAPPEVATGGAPHPLFGCLKGTVTIPEGVDLTEPADPDWGAR